MDIITLALSKKYTEETVIGLGALKGANCTVKSVEKKDGQNIVTFEWTGTDGTKKETKMYVEDGTPIYVWEAGNTYHYGDLVIYSSAFYRCITENSDTVFDDTKWNEIGSPDGSYDIVETKALLPARFTAADRKMYYCIADMCFYLWNGTEWKPQHNVVQLSAMPTAGANLKDRIIQYTGTTTDDYTTGYFYKCVEDSSGATPTYAWQNIETMELKGLTDTQVQSLLDILG